MFLNNFLLRLLFNFVPFEVGEYEKLKADVDREWSAIQYDPSKTLKENIEANPKQSKFTTQLKHYGSNVWVRCGLAALYIWLFREINIFMNPQLKPSNREDKE